MVGDVISTGTVKIFYPLKGYGFITREKGKDLFFHYKDILTKGADSNVLEGDKVEFVICIENGKAKAQAVRKLG